MQSIQTIPSSRIIRRSRAAGLGAAALLAIVTATSLLPGQAMAAECAGGHDYDNDTSLACGDGPEDLDFAGTVAGYSTAIGVSAFTNGEGSSAVGYGSTAKGHDSVALGAYSQAGAFSGMANPGNGNTAIGTGAKAGAGDAGQDEATALGRNSEANADNATALGAQSKANHAGSTAVGQGVETTRDNQMKLGKGDTTYTMTGLNSDASKAAQNGPKYIVTTDADGNVAGSTFDLAKLEELPGRMTEVEKMNGTQNDRLEGVEGKNETQDGRLKNVEDANTQQNDRLTDVEDTNDQQNGRLMGVEGKNADQDVLLGTHTNQIASLDSRVTGLEQGLNDLRSEVSDNREEARGGTALALAAASLRYDDRPGKLSIAGGIGHFKGLTGLSAGLGYATSDSFRLNAAISGVPERGDIGISAGLSWTLN